VSTLSALKSELKAAGRPEKAKASQWFFKTGPGEYGEGDVFLGITVPEQRKIAKNYYNLSLSDIEKLLSNKIHEERLTAVIILVEQFKKVDENHQKQIYKFYLANTKYINNWDIVDLSAPQIVGGWLNDKDKKILLKLAKSKSIWEKRIAMLATFEFIYGGQDEWTYKIAEILLNDEHDLIQKAVGWMLREAGKRVSQANEEEFLIKHYKTMPRTMLRYAIEKFDEPKRKAYLTGTV
jgi:3-methyladenine DNA glycosylase AlkD